MSERAIEQRSTEVRVCKGGTQLNQMEIVGTSASAAPSPASAAASTPLRNSGRPHVGA
jgi:hypothetical protein